MTEQINETPENIRSEGPQPGISARPRVQSVQWSDLLENDYQFYRTLVKNNIFRLAQVSDQRKISTWLRRCDEERDMSLKCGIIKLMLVSLQHTGGNMKLFRHSAPKNLPYLINTPNHLRELVDDMLTNFDSDSDCDDGVDDGSPRVCRPRRRTACTTTAAVSPDMTTVATAVADNRSVQAFYARSDYPVDTWRLPDCVRFPVHSRSATRWEKALRTDCPLEPRAADPIRIAQKTTEKKTTWEELPVFLPADDGKPWKPPKWNTSGADLTPMEQKCRGLMSEQISPFVNNEFRWYEHSRLDGSLRPTSESYIDRDVCGQEKDQQELDERAINVTNKIYPEGVRIVIDPRLVAEVVGTNVQSRRRADGNREDSGDAGYCSTPQNNE